MVNVGRRTSNFHCPEIIQKRRIAVQKKVKSVDLSYRAESGVSSLSWTWGRELDVEPVIISPWLFRLHRGWNTAQLHGDYDTNTRIPIKPISIMMECQLNGGDGESTKNFRYLRWRDSWTLWVATLGGRKVFPYRSRIHTAYIDEDSSILGSNKMFGEKRRQKHSLKLYAGVNYHFEPPKIGGLFVVSNIFDFQPDPWGR